MKQFIRYLLLTLSLVVSVSSQAEVVLKDTEGHRIPFSTLKGKWVLINYWAAWCQTCVDEIPAFNHFYKKHRKDPIALFAVNYDALPLFEQKSLIKQLHITYPSLFKNPAYDLKLGDITGVPVTFVFNPRGELANVLYGGQSSRTLEKALH